MGKVKKQKSCLFWDSLSYKLKIIFLISHKINSSTIKKKVGNFLYSLNLNTNNITFNHGLCLFNEKIVP